MWEPSTLQARTSLTGKQLGTVNNPMRHSENGHSTECETKQTEQN